MTWWIWLIIGWGSCCIVVLLFMKGAGGDPLSPEEPTQATTTAGSQRSGYDLVPAGFVADSTELLREFVELATPHLDGMGHTIEEGMRLRAAVVSAKLFLGNE